MEPRQQEQELEQTPETRPEEKKRRFRLVKLEDRIAPTAPQLNFPPIPSYHTKGICHSHVGACFG
jgi:hypothetical protein